MAFTKDTKEGLDPGMSDDLIPPAAEQAADEAIKKAKDRKGSGRKDGGQEQEPDGAMLKKLAPSLILLQNKVAKAQADYGAAVRKVAVASRFNAAVVRRLISVRVSPNYETLVTRHEQLSIALYEAGE